MIAIVLALELAVANLSPGTELLAIEELRLPSGAQVVCVGRMNEAAEALPLECIMDGSRAPVSVEEAIGIDSRSEYALRGNLAPDLWASLDSISDDIRTAVWIWAPTPRRAGRSNPDDEGAVDDALASELAAGEGAALSVLDACERTKGCSGIALDGIPAVVATATRDALRSLMYDQSIAAIDGVTEPAPGVTSDDYLFTDNFDWMQAGEPGRLPLRGAGQKIGVLERDLVTVPADSQYLPTHNPATETFCLGQGVEAGPHVAAVATVISGLLPLRSLDGSAPEARLLAVNNFPPAICDPSGQGNADSARVAGVNWATLNKGARTINFSEAVSFGGQPCTVTYGYGGRDRWVDYVSTHTPFPTFVTIAGNSGFCKPVGNSTFNGIVVGGTSDQGTWSRQDDTAWVNSNAKNPTTGLELPHVVAPADSLRALWNGNPNAVLSGTSLAAPQVAGLAAAIREGMPFLGSYPEAVKAVILASASKNVDGPSLSLSDGVDDRDGAGEINARLANDIASFGCQQCWNQPSDSGTNWGLLTAASFDGNGNSNDIIKITPSAPSLQVAMAWEVASTCSNPTIPASCPNVGPQPIGGFDLYLYEVIGQQRVQKGVSTSNSTLTNHRFIRFDNVVSNATYEVQVHKNFLTESTAYGISWVGVDPARDDQ
jgi:hypothetical protein